MFQRWWIYYDGKIMLKCFGFNKPSSGLDDGLLNVAWTTMDVFIKMMGEEKVCTKKDS